MRRKVVNIVNRTSGVDPDALAIFEQQRLNVIQEMDLLGFSR
jgi:hypothetical protein